LIRGSSLTPGNSVDIFTTTHKGEAPCNHD
jgi:hypothetical protein